MVDLGLSSGLVTDQCPGFHFSFIVLTKMLGLIITSASLCSSFQNLKIPTELQAVKSALNRVLS